MLCDKKFQLIGICVCVIMQWPCATDTGLLPGKKSAQNYIEELWERKSPARQAIYFNFSSIGPYIVLNCIFIELSIALWPDPSDFLPLSFKLSFLRL